mgnify:FL=1
MSFIEMVFSIFVGGLLVVSVLGYCGVIFWKWVLRDTLKSMEEAYEVYQSKLEQTFINKEEK